MEGRVPDSAPVSFRIEGSVGAIAKEDWDACAGSANPFVSHDFLAILEESGSVGPGTGWTPTQQFSSRRV